MTSLVQPLFDGPIDIVGDVHGEIEALCGLVHHLGYTERGDHPEGRRLVFLGDLTDRGPESPAVVELVGELVESGRAQCVLGNHDLNILLNHVKIDNWWFFGEKHRKEGSPTPQRLADASIRTFVTDFFRTLPLGLERADVRVVHACWQPDVIDLARQATDVLDLYHRHARLIDEEHESRPDLDDIDRGLERQNRNPVKVLTSGLERRIAPPFFAAGKWRHEERVRWWERYTDSTWCVFGHYAFEPDQCRSASRAVCMDFGVGKLWIERLTPGFSGSFKAKLGALRLPEETVVLDDRTSFKIG
jgi:hypothetical protein